VPLPPKCPELNPTENVWQFLRENWLSNRIFKSYDDILDHCCDAWNSSISLGASCPSSCAIGPSVLISAGWYYASKDSWTVSGASKPEAFGISLKIFSGKLRCHGFRLREAKVRSPCLLTDG